MRSAIETWSRAVAIVLALAPSSALAQPDGATLLANLGFSPDEIARVQAGEFVSGKVTPSSPRELTAEFAFRIDAAPATLKEQLRDGVIRKVDSTVTSSGDIHGNGSLADFAGLSFGSDAQSRAAAYSSGASDLNLSAAEVASFSGLSAVADVEKQLRVVLLARVQAYRAKGLAGIAPYVRGSGLRSPADELRAATLASQPVETFAPAAYQLLLGYPAGEPAGFAETFRWTQFDAHGTPTIALTHGLFIPDGNAFVIVQRQFYVSTGYNCEQAVAAILPSGSGTLVAYANRTSTDQITGFGGDMKREIGSKVLASQLQEMFQKLRAVESGR